MRNPKKDIPLIIIDTRNKGLQSLQDDRLTKTGTSTGKSPSFTELLPLLLLVIQKMWWSVQPGIQAFGEKVQAFIKNNIMRRNLPWFKLSVLALAVFILTKKDFQLNFAMASPLSVFSDDKNNSDESQISHAMSVSNPYAPLAADDLNVRRAKKFIRSYAKTAQAEMETFGVPASIKMAQALVESRAGTSKLAVGNNNFFGMKCFSKNCKKGHCSNATDDHHKDFFRIYKTPADSWRAHSRLISNGRYAHLKEYGTDYKKWAVGLKKAGYATDKRYHQKLINTIEKYELWRLDQ